MLLLLFCHLVCFPACPELFCRLHQSTLGLLTTSLHTTTVQCSAVQCSAVQCSMPVLYLYSMIPVPDSLRSSQQETLLARPGHHSVNRVGDMGDRKHGPIFLLLIMSVISGKRLLLSSFASLIHIEWIGICLPNFGHFLLN